MPVSTPQRMKSLERAQHVKRARLGLRRDLKQQTRQEGMWIVADLLEQCKPEFEGMRVDELLLMLGKPHAVRCLVQASVAPYRTVGELSERQKSLITGYLREWRPA